MNSEHGVALALPARYFLSLGRMVPKKNLAALVAAYARYVDGVAGDGRSKMEDEEKEESGEWRGTGDEPGKTDEDVELKSEKVRIKCHDDSSGQNTADTEARHTSHATSHRPIPALVFVGSGEEEAKLEEQARALGLEVVDRRDAGISESRHAIPVTRHKENCGAVFFYGFRQIEENPIFYAMAEAFILPSLYEEWGLVVNEAMACGLPVIVSRTAGCAEDLVPVRGQVTSDEWRVTSDGASEVSLSLRPSTINSLEQRSNGFVFDPESVEALATAMGVLAGDEGLRRRMGAAAREVIAGWGCNNFARQALCAARAAKGA